MIERVHSDPDPKAFTNFVQVGQKLFFKSGQRHIKDEEVEVAKVGRDWVHLSNGYRVRKGKRWCDGGGFSSPGQVWLDAQAYELWRERNRRYCELMRRTSGHQIPDHMTLDDVVALETIFRLPPQEA
jgi:hypothetical protein